MADKKSREVSVEYYGTYSNGSLIIDKDETSARSIEMRIDVDVSEALTGLKAIQRELREATKSIREYEDVIESVDGILVGNLTIPDTIDRTAEAYDLSEVPTKDLHEELLKREGVDLINVEPHGGRVRIEVDNTLHGYTKEIEGPARILINKD